MANDVEQYKKQQFYENWACISSEDPLRVETLRWKAENLLKLYGRNKFKLFKVAEIGGAEGTVLNTFVCNLDENIKAYNFELSQHFIDAGNKLYPNIIFIKKEISTEQINNKFDLIILSDIIEHVENDDEFLKNCAENTRYVLIKLPLEKNLHTRFLRSIGKLSELGTNHHSGHLHEYNIKSGLNLIKNNFEIIDYFYDDLPYNLRPTGNLTILGKLDNKIVRRACYYLPKKMYSKLYDSSLFILGKSKITKSS